MWFLAPLIRTHPYEQQLPKPSWAPSERSDCNEIKSVQQEDERSTVQAVASEEGEAGLHA